MPIKTIKNFFTDYLYRLNNGTARGDLQRTRSDSIKKSSIAMDERKSNSIINLILLITTFCTTTLAGGDTSGSIYKIIITGIPYSITLMLILGIHESGHYLAAKKFKVKATLPYFIPFPSIIGTMGAMIKTKSPIPDRRALLYIGAMGPLPGFIASLMATIIGIYLSNIQMLPVPGEVPLPIFGNSILFSFIVKIFHGKIMAGYDIFLHPIAWAGWIGLLITSLNLMPLGQLDGGHILYSLIGAKQVYVGWAMFGMLTITSFLWSGWIMWIILTLLFLMIAHPYVPKGPDLAIKEKIIGWICMIILALTFIPIPVKLI